MGRIDRNLRNFRFSAFFKCASPIRAQLALLRCGSSSCIASPPVTPPLKICVPVINTEPSTILMSETKFHELADHTLDAIQQLLGPLENELDAADISYSQGVLNIDLGVSGFWVINKQTPNRQLWWSSPLSGPRRYEFNDRGAGISAWRATADGIDLLTQLQREMLQASGIRLPDQGF